MSHVVIIGTGVAATLVARQILSRHANKRVTMLEAGSVMDMQDYRTWLDFSMSKQEPQRVFEDHKQVNQPSDSIADLPGSRLIMQGGSTNHWGGWALRFKPEDFALQSNAGRGKDWPLNCTELEQYYEQAEQHIGVAATKWHPAVPFTAKDAPVRQALSRAGVDYEPLAIARHSGKCVTTGTCKYCPVGARYSAALDLAELMRAYPQRLTVHDHSIAVGLGSGVSGRHVNQVRFMQHSKLRGIYADEVVVAAGALESAKLLLANEHGNTTFGNRFHQVGNDLLAHQLIRVVGSTPTDMLKYQHGLGFPTLAIRHFDTPEYQRKGKGFFVHHGSKGEPDVGGLMGKGELVQSLTGATRFELQGFIEYFSHPDNGLFLARGRDQHGLPNMSVTYKQTAENAARERHYEGVLGDLLRETGCADSTLKIKSYTTVRLDHAVGTCRMSNDERTGVVDRDLRVHGWDNLHVCSNGNFPNVAAVNPTLTLSALAMRLGEKLAG